MHRVFCGFSDEEYVILEKKAREIGMSTSKLIEYAATLFLEIPRTETPNVKEIQEKIREYLDKITDETFICAAPFGTEWARMTTSAKRTAASQMKKLVNEGVIEKLPHSSKAHQVSVYKKRGGSI